MAKLQRPYRPIFTHSTTPAAYGVKRVHFCIDWLGYAVSFVSFGVLGRKELNTINRTTQAGRV